jgi:hypothetical protein
MRPMKIRGAVYVALMVAGVLISAGILPGQDTPIGDVARQARAEKSQAPHAKKAVSDEDFGPQLSPVSETDDPAQVVNKARSAWMTDMPRTCREYSSNNSGTGSSNESLREMAAPDHIRIVVDRRGGSDPGHSEFIAIGSDMYSRNGTGPWRKDSAAGLAGLPHWVPGALAGDYATGELKLVRRDATGGAPAFLYETKFHPGGVAFGDTTTDFWVGTNDNLLLKIETLTKETGPSSGGAATRYTITCSYGMVPEIKPPI